MPYDAADPYRPVVDMLRGWLRIDEGGSMGPVEAYARALTRIRPLLGAVGMFWERADG